MRVLLIETKMKGMKNLGKEIHLSYIKKNFNDSVIDTCHFKAIYGANGAGKSSVVHAYDFYRYLVLNDFPLKDQLSISKYAKLINKKTNGFSIENTFAFFYGNKIFRYRHLLSVKADANGSLYFDHEKLCVLDERLNVSSVFFEVLNGALVEPVEKLENLLKADNMTLLQNSFVLLITNFIKGDEDFKTFRPAALTYYFAAFLVTSFGSKADMHESINIGDFPVSLNSPMPASSINGFELLNKASLSINIGNYAWIINKDDEKEYKEITRKFAIFLRKLNTNIRDVKVNFKHDGSPLSFCELKFIYRGYDVDYEFESTGVKKLCSLFLAFYKASKNHIVIIDEVDAGVHDLFIKALIEYFVAYTNCQIIVTTHHIELMESIKNLSKSIDILTDDCQIKTWTKSGDYSPSSLYRKGYLDGTPFNLNPFDFAEVFSEE